MRLPPILSQRRRSRSEGRLGLSDADGAGFAAEHYADFLGEVGAGIAAGRIRDREDIVDGLENAPGASIGMLEGRNFGKLIVRVAA